MINQLNSPPTSLQPMIIRGEVIKAIRRFFEQRSFQEIISPVLNRSLPLEPTLFAFQTNWSTSKGEQQLFLSTSPEACLKKMLAAGVGNCYSLGKSFRNLENSGPQHNPEFLMLEWYRENANYLDIIQETQDLINFVQQQLGDQVAPPVTATKNWPSLSLVDFFSQYAQLDLETLIDDQSIKLIMEERGYQVNDETWEQLFNQIFLNEIEPHLPATPFFLVDFPAKISPLCQIQASRPWLAERFEIYLGGWEIGNGNTEALDTELIKRHFQAEVQARKARAKFCPPIDQEFLAALAQLKTTGKSYAGIGLGVDRLTMWLTMKDDIKLIEPFYC